jgi:hypothetical protein
MSPLNRLFRTALAIGLVGFATPTRAITISNFIETRDSLSFDFSGEGRFDFIHPSLHLGDAWYFIDSHRTGGGGGFTITVYHFIDIHMPAPLLYGDTGLQPFGSPLTASDTVAHGDIGDHSGVDSFTFEATINAPAHGGDGWGTFSGSFSAVHRVGGVPDAASTVALASVAFGLLGVARRFLGRAS